MRILYAVIGTVVTLIVVGLGFTKVWPLISQTVTGNVTAMSGTDAGTGMFKAFWPIIVLIVGIGAAVGLVIYALRKFGLMGGGV